MNFEPPRQRDTEAGVLPLINVVFLLLIFFMIAGTLSTPTAFEVAPPHSASNAEPAADPLVLLIGSDGQLALGAEPVDQQLLVDTLQALTPASGQRHIQIRADAGVDAQYLIAVMARLREAGIEKLRLLTIKDDGA